MLQGLIHDWGGTRAQGGGQLHLTKLRHALQVQTPSHFVSGVRRRPLAWPLEAPGSPGPVLPCANSHESKHRNIHAVSHVMNSYGEICQISLALITGEAVHIGPCAVSERRSRAHGLKIPFMSEQTSQWINTPEYTRVRAVSRPMRHALSPSETFCLSQTNLTIGNKRLFFQALVSLLQSCIQPR